VEEKRMRGFKKRLFPSRRKGERKRKGNQGPSRKSASSGGYLPSFPTGYEKSFKRDRLRGTKREGKLLSVEEREG